MRFKTKKSVLVLRQRFILAQKSTLRKKPLLKSKLKGLALSGGRNYSGKITVKHKGGGRKRKLRKMCFDPSNFLVGIICSLEYDPNRNSNIASVYSTSEDALFYVLAAKNLKVGDIIKSGPNAEPKLGHSLPLRKIPAGSFIYNVVISKTKAGQISRAAGTCSTLAEKTLEHAKIKLSSGKQKLVSSKYYATIGVVSNESIFLVPLKKAGQSRWLNKRPTVRGVAMNPVDHPHGGGEGKKSGKGKTPWGRPKKLCKTC